MQASAYWVDGFRFIGRSGSGHGVIMDESGGGDDGTLGPSPMEMLLLGLAGCTGIDVVHILKKMRPPFFVTGSATTEDVYFCIRLQKEQGISVYCDPTIEVTHIVDRYAVNKSNRDQILKFEETVNSKSKEENLSDRGQEYIDQCKKRFEEKIAS